MIIKYEGYLPKNGKAIYTVINQDGEFYKLLNYSPNYSHLGWECHYC